MKISKLLLRGLGPLLALGIAGCAGMPQPADEYSTETITITNIPLTVHGQPAYKIYVYVSDSMSQRDPHSAQSAALLNGVSSLTMRMYHPPADYPGKDPDDHGEPWSGTGSYFTVIVSPQNAPGEESILVRAGQAFNKPNQNRNFNELIRLSESTLFADKVTAIYQSIIRADNQGIESDINTP